MKKQGLLLLSALALLLTVSCAKNPAEPFEGTYDMMAVATSTLEMPTGQHFPVTDTLRGPISVTLDEEKGSINVSGLINATGTVDKEGVLHLDPCSLNTSFWLPFGWSVDADLSLKHGNGKLDGGLLKWTATAGAAYSDDYTFTENTVSFVGQRLLAE